MSYLDDIMSHVGASGGDKKQLMSKWSEYVQLYDGSALGYTPVGWQNSSALPTAHKIVRKMVAKSMLNLFSVRPVEFDDVREGEREAIEWLNTLVNTQVKQDLCWRRKWEDFLVQKFVLGTSVMKVMKGDTGPDFEFVDIHRFYIEPGARSIKDAGWCAEEFIRDKAHVKRMIEHGIYSVPSGTDWEYMAQEGATDVTAYQGTRNWDNEATDQTRNTFIDYKSKCNLIEHWTDERKTVVMNGKWIIQDIRNPYDHGKKPYVSGVAEQKINSFWGNSVYWRLKDLFYDRNKLWNMKMDASMLEMNKMGLASRRAGLNPQNYETEPGKIVDCNDPMSVRFLEYATAFNIVSGSEQQAVQEIQSGSSITDYNSGEARPAMNDTAQGVSILAQEANEILRLSMQGDEETLKSFFYLWVEIDRQFIENVSVKKKTFEGGYQYTMFSGNMIPERYNIVVKTPSEIVNKNAYLQNFMQFYQLAKNNPDIDQYELNKRMVEAFELDNPDKLLLDRREKIDRMLEVETIKFEVQGGVEDMQAKKIKEQTLAQANIEGQMNQPMASTVQMQPGVIGG